MKKYSIQKLFFGILHFFVGKRAKWYREEEVKMDYSSELFFDTFNFVIITTYENWKFKLSLMKRCTTIDYRDKWLINEIGKYIKMK